MSYFIIVRGPLGVGKTTIAKKLTKVLHAEYIAVDRILDEHGLTKDIEDGYISQRSFITANEIVTPRVKKIIKGGTPVVFDGNFYWKSQIDDLINKIQCQHYIFTLKAPLKVCIERDSKRKKVHGRDASEAVYKKSTEFDYGTPIDATQSINQCVNEIFFRLKK